MLSKYPKQIKFIVGNEAAERFSFYGMKSILIVFMTSYLLIQKNVAVSYYHAFTAATYLLPLVGAYVSDRLWGKYKTILYLSTVYCLGHLVLALYETQTGLLIGLSLIALGAGGIKPCVSAHVGDQFAESQRPLLAGVYNIFYWMINFGSFFSTLLIPFLLDKYGSQVAFGLPGVLMLVATVIFKMGKPYYVHVPPQKANKHGLLPIMISALKNKSKTIKAKILEDHPLEALLNAQAILKILLVYVWISVFWALYDQSGSTWVLQAQKMDLLFLGIQWSESQIQAFNPILVMVLIPIFSRGVYPLLGRMGLAQKPLSKMSLGMFFATLSYLMVAATQFQIEAGKMVGIEWQLGSYFLITIAEVMISVTGLEFAYTYAPVSAKSTIMSFWLLTVFFGNILASYFAQIDSLLVGSTQYFIFYAIFMALTGLVFYVQSRFLHFSEVNNNKLDMASELGEI